MKEKIQVKCTSEKICLHSVCVCVCVCVYTCVCLSVHWVNQDSPGADVEYPGSTQH